MKFKINKKSLLTFGIIAAMISSLTACSSNNGQTKSSSKIINVGMTSSPVNLNPIDPGDNASMYMASILYQPLLELDDDMTFKPMLADSIETSDNKTFTVNLNKNAKWTDGKPVTADDVIFTVKLMCNPKAATMTASNFNVLEGFDSNGLIKDATVDVAGIKKVDDHTVKFIAKAPISMNIFNNEISRTIMTVPQHIFKDADPATLNKNEELQKPKVTDGPFKLVAYEKDQSVQFEANKDYFRGSPKIDKLNFKILQGTDITVQLESGEIDMNMAFKGKIPSEDYAKVKSMSNLVTTTGKPSSVQFLFINNKVLSDTKLRQSISYAVDRKLIVDNLLKGQGEVADSFFTSNNPYLNKNLEKTPYNPEKAKQLLKESGWDTTKAIRFNVPTGDKTREQAADIIVDNLKAIGLNIQVQKFDFATAMSKAKNRDYDITFMGDSLIPIDPIYDLPFFVTSGNYCDYTNKEVDNIVAAVKTETDDNKVKADLYKMQEILAKDVPMPILYATNELFATNKRVLIGKPKDYGTFINLYQWDVK